MDTFGKCDAFVEVFVRGQRVGKTRTMQKTFDPVWPAHVIGFVADLTDEVTLKLSDEDNVTSSDPVGEVKFEIGKTYGSHTLPLDQSKYLKKKKQTKSTLTFTVTGMKSYMGVAQELRHHQVPGVLFDDHKERLYIPFAGWPVYVGIEWEKKGDIDVKLFSCKVPDEQDPNTVYLDIVLNGSQGESIRRRTFTREQPLVICGVNFYEEVKIDDLSTTTDFSQLTLLAFEAEQAFHTTCSPIVQKAGWKGALNYRGARQLLQGVQFDDKEEEIFFQVDDHAYFVVDFDEGDVDIKVVVVAPAIKATAWDLSINKGSVKKKSRSYYQPKPVLNGTLQCVRYLELDDVPYGTNFADMTISMYNLKNSAQYALTQLVALR